MRNKSRIKCILSTVTLYICKKIFFNDDNIEHIERNTE